MNTLKECTLCGKEKSITDYFRDNKNRDGFAARCKICKGAKKKQDKIEPPIVKKKDNLPYKEKTFKRPQTRPSRTKPLPTVSGFKRSTVSKNDEITPTNRLEEMLEDAGAKIVDVTPKDEYSDIDEILLEKPAKVTGDFARSLHPAKVTITGANEKTLLDEIEAKYPQPKVLSWNKNGAIFQHMADPRVVFKGKDTKEVLKKALAY